MRRLVLITSLLISILPLSRAQMWNGTDTLYGNEWIHYDQSYFKISVAADGIYRIPYGTLSAAGLPVDALNATQYQLWRLGEEQPLYTSTTGTLSDSDYLEFYGQKNRSELDRYLFRDPDNEMLNPWYSLFTDTSAYFLTWVAAGEPTLRYESVDNDLTDLPGKEEWFWGEGEMVFSNQFGKQHIAITSSTSIYYSHYAGEGFARASNVSHSFAVNSPGAFGAGPDASLELRLLSNDNTAGHALEVRVNGALSTEETFSGSRMRQYHFPLAASSLGAAVNVEVKGLNTNDKYWVSGAILRYPRQFNLSGLNYLPLDLPTGSGPRYLELENLGGNQPAVLLDLTNGQRLLPEVEGSLLKVKLPASTEERRVVVATAFQTVAALERMAFINYESTNADFLIITHPQLFDDGQGNNWVQEYADYRASEPGGGYKVAVVDVQQLYEQYAYGLNRHPLSIRNFVHYAVKHWDNPRYCFLIGKGQEYQTMRTAAALQSALTEGWMLVPSFGNPASDNLLLSDNYTSVPILPVGRLAATNGAEVKIYLDKVQALEATVNNPQTIEDRAWMKHIVHLGGGSTAGEQASIKTDLQSLAREIEGSTFGAKVFPFYKTTTDPIQTSLSEQIFQRINEGTSIITFFGHSSPGTFDFNIDNPDNYSNYGKYPFMLSLGCYSGNIFINGKSIGERFTFYENKATIAFGASRGVGYSSSLASFARTYYGKLGNGFYGQGIGDALRATVQVYDLDASIGMATLVQQFTLHGDPAIRLHPAPGPDYTIDPASVQFEPRVVTAQQSSFTLRFDALNLGRNQQDSFAIQIRQQLPDGTILLARRDTVAAPAYRGTYSYELPVIGKEAVGLNTFFISVDADNTVAELPVPAAELNNELVRANGEPGVILFIVDNTARPVYPPNLALVGETPITLKASTTDALAPERTYLMEIDTTALFDSPLKQRTAITQRGGVIKWTPSLPWQDSTAYYWRISPDSTEAAVGYTWEQSSFTYIEGSPNGWGQGHYWQWLEGAGDGIRIDDERRKFTFAENFTDFRIRNKIPESNFEAEGFINGVRWTDFFRWEVNQSINIVVFDTLGRIMWNDRPGQYGSLNTTASKEIACFPFPVQTTVQRQNIITFLDSIVPASSLVFLYTAMRNPNVDLYVQEWAMDSIDTGGKNIFNVLESEGAGMVRALQLQMAPYIFCYRKGEGVIHEEIASSLSDVLIFEYAVKGYWDEGRYSSPVIGPAKQWGRAYWNYTLGNANDTMFLSLIGIDTLGNRSIIMDEVESMEIGLGRVDPNKFPYLQFQFYAKDEVETTAPQLNFWHILYEGIPDLAVNPALLYQIQYDTIQQGQGFLLDIAVENVGNFDADSLLVKFVLADQDNDELFYYQRYKPLEKGDTLAAAINLDSKSLSGLYRLSLELNPNFDQPEQNLFNNFSVSQFFVEKDQRNPILDVTFDGLHIADGDLISSKPEIIIRLKDENYYLSLIDTNAIRLFVRYPDGTSLPVVIDGEKVVFYPANTASNNVAQIEYRPSFEENGQYELVVKAQDATGNLSGRLDYRTSFEVINERRISNVLNYPNPFSTATHFVYTLTGDIPPANFKIQIMTVSGRIIREITQDELGVLRIGTHQTDYSWDGRDEYGDRLANGVYLYRVYAKDADGHDYESYNNGSSQYFKRGIGKLVILR